MLLNKTKLALYKIYNIQLKCIIYLPFYHEITINESFNVQVIVAYYQYQLLLLHLLILKLQYINSFSHLYFFVFITE